ncbi:hypothetical protein [Mesorhizobium sp.]|uniref:hypothetical protein n=1 Tax=Mesorhizobium sp. TaxID=1871066 RepID=UPI000FE45D00|nr:hypothetical protein [Mesorhizobium sp.]RWP05102.1 MAG: hypothetical protein EOQ99_16665 [Mesorhizobium sp.]
MGSSGGGTSKAPNIPAPPAGMINPVGQAVPYTPQYTSFLPNDPTAMATGLTPEMIATIMASAQPPPAQASGPGPQLNMRDQLAALQARNRQQRTPLRGRGGEGGRR